MTHARQGARRRWAIGVGIGAFVVSTGIGVALAADSDRPDPARAATVEDELGTEHAHVHLDGWRQELSAESVQCLVAVDDGPPRMLVHTTASAFPLEEPLTRHRLIEECATGTDLAANLGGHDPARASTCLRNEEVPAAAVVLDGGCGDLRELGDDDLARLNRMRAIEVDLLAVPSDSDCPTLDEATSWAEAQVRAAGEDLVITSFDEGTTACYRPVTYWNRGEVLVQPLGQQPE